MTHRTPGLSDMPGTCSLIQLRQDESTQQAVLRARARQCVQTTNTKATPHIHAAATDASEQPLLKDDEALKDNKNNAHGVTWLL